MADADADLEEKRKRVGEVGDELDAFIDAIQERNKTYRYQDGFTRDNWEEVSSRKREKESRDKGINS